ncbi:hypothetical protein BC941DRAFT_390041 [Chlamydoabsidia padenii]|nr:hypothetical protein BC941DRAFT_390041 [Chlamydoabsidia padenii]
MPSLLINQKKSNHKKRLSRRSHKTIAVNLDNTLAHTLESQLAWHNDLYATNHCVDDLTCVDLTELWGAQDTCTKIRQFYQSQAFDTIEPIHDFALEALKMLKKRQYRLVIITSRPQYIAKETKRFVDKHYPGIFDSIYFCNLGLSETEQLHYVSKRKSTICQEIGVDVLIDHRLDHVLECAKLGVDVLLYDRHYQWNTNNHIKCATTWRDIIHHHFPKPNSPLRQLIYSMDDDEQDALDHYEYYHYHNQHLDQDGNEIILLEEDEEDEQYIDHYGYEIHHMEDWSIVV